MTNPIELPSGKLLDLDPFIALVPDDAENEEKYQLILEGYPQPIYLEQKDVFIFKDKLSQKLKSTKHLNHWNRKEQLQKNQPLMDLINKWLQQKTDQISTPEEEQEYKDVQAELLESRM